jgi:transposase
MKHAIAKLFNKWVKESFIKELKVEQVVIMDNAAFHNSQKTQDLIEAIGCRLIFLPSYSPNLNPIEKFWNNMKKWIKSHSKNNIILLLNTPSST